METVRSVSFDLFNTLITVERDALTDALNRLLDRLREGGFIFDSRSFQDDHRQAALECLEKSRKDGKETHNSIWISAALMKQGYSVFPSDPRIDSAVEGYFSAFLDHARVIPGTREMLGRLRGRYRLGLLSNFTHAPAARSILDHLGLTGFFDAVVISGEIGYRKPHARAFEALVGDLGLDTGHIVFVGDDPEPDMHGAQQAGLKPVLSTYVRDHHLPFAPGYLSDPGDFHDAGIPRISEWKDLLRLLGLDGRDPS